MKHQNASPPVTCADVAHPAAPRGAPDPAALAVAAGMFRAMGDEARLRVLHHLAQGECCVTELVDALGEKFPTVSQRLRVLRAERLVARRRDGTHVYYTLADQHVARLLADALDHAGEPGARPQPEED